MPGEKIPLLARIAGGRVLGPRPGKAIVTFWQGIVEIVLRSLAIVAVLVLLIPAAIALYHILEEETKKRLTYPDVTEAGCIFVILVGIVGGALQTTQIILRFVNIGVINMVFRTYGIVDMIAAGVVSVLLLVGVVITGFSTHSNARVSIVSTPLGVTCGFCFLPMIAVVVQGVWMCLFVLKKWNKHVVTYTLKRTLFS